jgi:hypothetical protein
VTKLSGSSAEGIQPPVRLRSRIEPRASDAPKVPVEEVRLQIYWQKQPGANADRIYVTWHDGSGHTYKTKGELGQDRVITLAPAGVTFTQGHLGIFQLPRLSLG